MKNKKFSLISAGIFSVIVSAFTSEANLVEDLMLLCLLFIACCKFTEEN